MAPSHRNYHRLQRNNALEGRDWKSIGPLHNVMRSDRIRLWRQLNRIAMVPALLNDFLLYMTSDTATDPTKFPTGNVAFASWLSELTQAIDRSNRRRGLLLSPNYDASLPIESHRNEIVEAIGNHQVIVVCGETGSGKSTQLPKYCWEAGLGRNGWIGHTQPRRIAARSIATRLSEELGANLGEVVGYKIRFTDRVSHQTVFKLMTDGILLTEIRHDRWLQDYDCLIIDEAHERSINIDLTLAYIKRILQQRSDMRVVLTSATIDAEKFAAFFPSHGQPAPIFYVSGRTYGVEIRYRPFQDDRDAFVTAVDELQADSHGDILVFLATERDIRHTERILRGHLTQTGRLSRTDILPLYARMSESEQQRIFHPSGRQRVILATNVAESSLTVPGVRNVIDFGLARMSRYAPRSKVQRLPIEPISQASANQRAGRCGRVAEGICVRLYEETEFVGRPAYTTPEIRRANLANVMLQTKLAGIHDLEQIEWLESPLPESVRDAKSTLIELNAVDADERLTDVGRKLGKWPVDPRISKIILSADENRCLADCLIIAAGLEVLDPRMRPADHQAAADQAHQKFQHPASDFGGMLLLWDFYHGQKQQLSRSRFEKMLRNNFLSPNRFREWIDVHRQLTKLTESHGMKIGTRRWIPHPVDSMPLPEKESNSKHKTSPKQANVGDFIRDTLADLDYAAVHMSLLSGLLSGIAMKRDDGKYHGAARMELQIWPGSGVRRGNPRWIVAAELVETTTRYARNIAAIDDDWIPPLAEHLIKYSYDSPHFSSKGGRAMIHRKRSLFGLPVGEHDRVPLASIDAQKARELLIDVGIVQQQLKTQAAFVKHNEKFLVEVEEFANRTRQRELILDTYFLEQFFHQRIPEFVVDRHTLEAWDRTLEANDSSPNSPYLSWATLPQETDPQTLHDSFPDHISVGEATVPVSYTYLPGDDTDGVTAMVPESAITQVSEDRAGWLVPGLLKDRVLALIKSLPKRLRRNLTPAPDSAEQATRMLLPEYYAGSSFWPQLCKILSKISGESICQTDFDLQKLPPHLKLQIAVVDPDGKVKAIGRDIDDIRTQLNVSLEANRVTPVDDCWLQSQTWYRSKMTTFDIESLPDKISIQQSGTTINRFPSLADRTTHVETVLLDHPSIAEYRLRQSLVRLIQLANSREIKSQVRHLPGIRDAQLRLGRILNVNELEEGLGLLLVRIGLVDGQQLVRSQRDFQLRLKDSVKRLAMAAADVGSWLPKFADAYQQMSLLMESTRISEPLRIDIKEQLNELFVKDFLQVYRWEWLKEYPRYLNAIHIRIQKWSSGGQAIDQRNAEIITSYCAKYREIESRCIDMLSVDDDPLVIDGTSVGPLEQLQWMVQEFRVSLFAQQLGTALSVSPKRLDKLISQFKI